MKHITSLMVLAFLALLVALPVMVEAKQVNVIASVPELRCLVERVGGERVSVTSIARGHEDPHFVEPRPTFITSLARADLLFVNGMELEVWLPPILKAARNSRIMPPSGVGYIDCSLAIDPKEVPAVRVDPSMGHVHPSGNPHYLTDPANGVRVAELIARKLGEFDPDGREVYQQNYQKFRREILDRIPVWRKKFGGIKNLKIVEHHPNFVYFADFFGIERVGNIESRPGIPPTGRDLARITDTMKGTNTRVIIRGTYHADRFSNNVAGRVGGRVVALPVMVGAVPEAGDYISYMDYLVETLAKALLETDQS